MENRGHFHPQLPFSSDDQARAGTFAGVSTLTTTATMMFSANAGRREKGRESYGRVPRGTRQPAGCRSKPFIHVMIAFRRWGAANPRLIK
ncbi:MULTISPECIES: hypothetical protein [Rhizobium]|uniref:hypothetical protein n=1 Tax=Rhizobium TaxID=379 RepID=UPI0004624E43|nr:MULTISPECIES: hypothetical protein [Rhizobium]MCA0800766.1 hypothetical protein [Rhizobium sp. T1473]MCS0458170.1 hypothetical protein [Rhizobium favelukesii]UFS81730.1 hypothetical protein LPB79_26070 [Rhizobium sp. T136]